MTVGKSLKRLREVVELTLAVMAQKDDDFDGFSGIVNFAVHSPYFIFLSLQDVGKHHFNPQDP
jgi:hypothetical protein